MKPGFRWSLVYKVTRVAGSCTGIGFRKMALTSVKIAVLAPIPRPSERTTTAVKPGLLAIPRSAYCMSFQRVFTIQLPRARLVPFSNTRKGGLMGGRGAEECSIVGGGVRFGFRSW